MNVDINELAARWASNRRTPVRPEAVLLVIASESKENSQDDWLATYQARRRFEDAEEMLQREPRLAYDGGDDSPFGVACARTLYCALRGIGAPEEQPLKEPTQPPSAEKSPRRWEDLKDNVELPIGRMGSLSEEDRALLRERVQRRDRRAAEALVKGNLGLVHQIVKKYERFSAFSDMPYEDMVQEGTLGLLQAAEEWDPERAAFSTWASMWIKHALRRAIQDQGLVVKVPHRFLFTYKQVQGEEHARTMMRLDRLDTPVFEDSEVSLGGTLSSGDAGVDDKLDDARRQHAVRSFIEEFVATLDARKADILRRRYLTDEPATLDEIGQTYGIGKERVRQLQEEAILAMREFLKRRGITAADAVGFGS